MLYIRSSDLIFLITKNWNFFFNQSPSVFPTSEPLTTTFLLCFQEFEFSPSYKWYHAIFVFVSLTSHGICLPDCVMLSEMRGFPYFLRLNNIPLFPDQWLNPGHGGESARSCPLDSQGIPQILLRRMCRRKETQAWPVVPQRLEQSSDQIYSRSRQREVQPEQ